MRRARHLDHNCGGLLLGLTRRRDILYNLLRRCGSPILASFPAIKITPPPPPPFLRLGERKKHRIERVEETLRKRGIKVLKRKGERSKEVPEFPSGKGYCEISLSVSGLVFDFFFCSNRHYFYIRPYS